MKKIISFIKRIPIEKIFAFFSIASFVICIVFCVRSHITLSKNPINDGIEYDYIDSKLRFYIPDIISDKWVCDRQIVHFKDGIEECKKGKLLKHITKDSDFALVKVEKTTLNVDKVLYNVKVEQLFQSANDVKEGDNILVSNYNYTYDFHSKNEAWTTTLWNPWMKPGNYYLINYKDKFRGKRKAELKSRLGSKLPTTIYSMGENSSWVECIPVTLEDAQFIVEKGDKKHSIKYTYDEIAEAQIFTTRKSVLAAWNKYRNEVLNYYLKDNEYFKNLKKEADK